MKKLSELLNPFSLRKNVSFEYSGTIDSGVELISKYVTKPSWQPSWQLKSEMGLLGNVEADKIEIWLLRPSGGYLTPMRKSVGLIQHNLL